MKHIVPGQAEGYYLQETRFLAHLLAAGKGTVVSLEYLGDVASENADGTVISEEDKSSIDGNPVSDRSVALWKTISNWVNDVKDGSLDLEKTIFRLYVPKSCTGNFVKAFSDAKTIDDAKKVLNNAIQELWGKEPECSFRANVADTLKPFIDNVFEASNRKIVCKIMTVFEFETGKGSSYSDIDDAIRNKAIAKEIIDQVRIHLLGWTKEKIDIFLEQGKPARISYDEFHEEMISYVRKAYRRQLLINFAQKPTLDAQKHEMKESKTYLQQLELIDADYDDKLRAISDYLMASVNRAEWAERDIVHESSFDDLIENLMRTWENKKSDIEILNAALPEKSRGKLLYNGCFNHSALLEGNPVPEHFIPGSFHALSDGKKLGWHPQWKNLLVSEEAKEKGRS